ncbi:hypothetical protein [Streptomyces sp. NPDC052610]|uniref:hypothetical protein n=1 Tax=Streptomyces sp. NPDC052610 TaxID=3154952 RepID=UPI0034253855
MDVAGAGLAAVYLVDAEAEELRIVHTAGGLGGFALPEILPLSADSPLAEAVSITAGINASSHHASGLPLPKGAGPIHGPT